MGFEIEEPHYEDLVLRHAKSDWVISHQRL
jgi:hypothetical protein